VRVATRDAVGKGPGEGGCERSGRGKETTSETDLMTEVEERQQVDDTGSVVKRGSAKVDNFPTASSGTSTSGTA